MTSACVAGGERGEQEDWATMAEEEEWRAQHEKARLDKKDARLDDLLVATCGDDGDMRVWRPLQVTACQMRMNTPGLFIMAKQMDWSLATIPSQ